MSAAWPRRGCGSQKQAQWPRGTWSHGVPPCAPGTGPCQFPDESFQEFHSPAPSHLGEPPCLAWLMLVSNANPLVQISNTFLFCPLVTALISLNVSQPCGTLELPGGALENKNSTAWAHSWKTDFFGLRWSPGVSILSWAPRDENP